jgi:hypothetical protein
MVRTDKPQSGFAFSEDDLNFIIRDGQDEFWGITGQSEGYRDALRPMIIKRRQHFHNLSVPGIAPVLAGALKEMPVFQTDILRRTHQQLKPRLTENHFTVRIISPTDSAKDRKPANKVELVVNQGIRLIEERLGYTLQGALSDGQIIDGVGLLHWQKRDELIPPRPDPEELGSVRGFSDDDKNKYRRTRKNGKTRYVQKAEDVEEKHKNNFVKAGFPWHCQVVSGTDAMWWEDDDGLAMVIRISTVRLLQYVRDNDKQAPNDNEIPYLSFNDADEKLRFYRVRGEAPTELTGRTTFNDRVMIAHVWTRDEFYELISDTIFQDQASFVGGWILNPAKTMKHPYGDIPWAVVPAVNANSETPELKYEPMLEGVFRLKPLYDRSTSLMLGFLEQDANPFYYLRSLGPGQERLLDEDGDTLYVTQDSDLAKKIPDGYELVRVDFDVGPGEVEAVKFLRDEIHDAIPSTGKAEVGTSTQPWTMRLNLQQENIEPKSLIQLQNLGFQKMVRSMLHVMSLPAEEGGFGEPVYAYCKVVDGEVEKRSIIGIEPEDVQTLDVEIDTVSTSQSERITLVEHGRALLADPMVPLTTTKFIEEYMGEADPDKVYAQWQARQAFEQQVIPAILPQELAAWLGTRVLMGNGGEFIGPGGVPMSPEQVLAANGEQTMQQPAPSTAPVQPPGGLQGNVMMPAQPALPNLEAPDTIPMAGMQG